MKRWCSAIVAVLLFSTAAVHSLAHIGDADSSCAVCHVQQDIHQSVPSPRVVPIPSSAIPAGLAVSAPVLAALADAVSARAPPSLTA